jgi:hypothetical protein
MTTAVEKPTAARRNREKAAYTIQQQFLPDDKQASNVLGPYWTDLTSAGPFDTTAKAEAHIRKNFREGTFRVIRVTAEGTIKVKTVEKVAFGQ